MENSSWLIGNGKSINLWQDSRCADPLEAAIKFNTNSTQQLPQLGRDYISNYCWNIPSDLLGQHPHMRLLVMQVILPVEDTKDQLIWKQAFKWKADPKGCIC